MILDVAHNPHAAARLAENLARLDRSGAILAVFAMLKDKDIKGVVAAVAAQVREWFVAPLPGLRGADLDRTTGALREAHAPGLVMSCSDVATALQRARGRAGPDDKIVVFGSFHTVAAALRAMNHH